MENKVYFDKLRHTSAHLLAAAILELYPEAKPTIGPSVENGFYYDFDNLKVSENDFPKIEEKMHEIVKSWESVEKTDESLDQIKERFRDNKYKLELISEFESEGKEITTYKSGEFVDLCRGGHIDNPSEELKYFKLLSVAGAYWHGDEKNPMLTRIYGTALKSKDDLDNHLTQIEEAKKYDHRKLGKELDLFTFSEYVGSGLPLYTTRGALIRRLINEYVESVQSKQDYQQVWTPQIAKAELFKKSGHYDKYKDDMFKVISNYSDEEFYLKPMNCPQHTQIYASQARSYRDLPIRMTDFAMLYRDERPGELSGLARVRSFSQDDCHIFCTEEQVDDEIDKALNMIKKIMETFDFKYRYRLSTRDKNTPEKYLGDPNTWDKVEAWAVEIMKRNEIDYFDGPGEAAFYAPKMDLMATDALGREWQLSTIQIDYVMPERFNLKYTDKDGELKTPIMLHRAIVGSPERFIMIILEHYKGALPLWLSPVQVQILPITDRVQDYAYKLKDEMESSDVRASVDDRSETLQAKIRDAQIQKIPYMVIVGDKEMSENKVTVRKRNGEENKMINITDFVKDLVEKNDNKSQEL